MNIPPSASSIRVTLRRTDGTIATTRVFYRTNNDENYFLLAEFAESLGNGEYHFEAIFFSEQNAGGTATGSARGDVRLAADDRYTTVSPNIDSLTYESNISSVEITAGQAVPVGSQADLIFTLRAKDGTPIHLPVNALQFSIASISPAGCLALKNNKIEAIRYGNADITMRVDDVTSPPVRVQSLGGDIVAEVE